MTPKVDWSSVNLYNLFKTSSGSSPFLLITILIPSLLDSSLKSEISVIFFHEQD